MYLRPAIRLHNAHLVKDPEAFKLLRLIAIGAGLVGFLTMTGSTNSSWIAAQIGGLGLIIFGLVIMAWANLSLGPYSWLPGIGTKRYHNLVTAGPYRFVRHPAYTSMFISGIGIGLVSLNLFYLAAGLMWAVAPMSRITLEEGRMVSKFSHV